MFSVKWVCYFQLNTLSLLLFYIHLFIHGDDNVTKYVTSDLIETYKFSLVKSLEQHCSLDVYTFVLEIVCSLFNCI